MCPTKMTRLIALALLLCLALFAESGPRPGKYNIYSYGAVANNPLYLGHLEILAGG